MLDKIQSKENMIQVLHRIVSNGGMGIEGGRSVV